MKKKIATMAFLALLGAAPAHACGWYLMSAPAPKEDSDTYWFAKQIPIAEPVTSYKDWTKEESFDSAAQCKQNLLARQQRAQAMFLKAKSMGMRDDADWFLNAGRVIWNMADCVASDDPRLAR